MSCLTTAGPSCSSVGDGSADANANVPGGKHSRYGVPTTAAAMRECVGDVGAEPPRDARTSCASSRVLACVIARDTAPSGGGWYACGTDVRVWWEHECVSCLGQ
jgi:hypothetical protein